MSDHRIPGCDGRWHHTDGGCIASVAEMPLDGQGKVYADLVAIDDEPVHITVYTFDLRSDDVQGRFTDPAELHALAARYRAFADALDMGAALLPRPGGDGVSTIDYVARFKGFDSDVLFELEEAADCDAPQEYVEHLLVTLADWRGRLVDGSRVDGDDYERCLNAVREAWLQYSFRWIGGPVLPYPFDLPAVTS